MKKLLLVFALTFAGATIIQPLAAPVHAAKTNNKIATFNIDGMTCSGCVQGISGMLERISGVQSASVNLSAKTATVRYDAARASVFQMRRMITEAGFKVKKVQSRAA